MFCLHQTKLISAVFSLSLATSLGPDAINEDGENTSILAQPCYKVKTKKKVIGFYSLALISKVVDIICRQTKLGQEPK